MNVWYALFDCILFAKYSSSIQKLIIEEKYFTMYEKEMISAFYYEFNIINDSKYHYTILLDIEEGTLRERLKNIFIFSNLSKNKSEKLI